MSSWNSLLESVPEDGKPVWCRVTTFYTTPVQLIWKADTKVFYSEVTGLEIPWYYVVRWRDVD